MTSNSTGVAGAAIFHDGDFVGYPGMALTDVGAYGANSDSYYGTNDQAGNVWEWTDAVNGPLRMLRGGDWSNPEFLLRSSSPIEDVPTVEDVYFGFRVASAVPEPSGIVLTMLAIGMMLVRRKR
jgi:sulfatase modifying factor 1